MDNILPRKYNNRVVIGLGVALVVAVGVAIYFYTREQPQKQPQHAPLPKGAVAQKPEHIETPLTDVTGKPALVLIWAKWCGWSQKFKPTWDKVADILRNDGAIEVGEIESGENKDEFTKATASIPNFPGFPHVRFYPEGYGHNKPSIPYDGDRTEESILKFAYQSFK
jgi:thiol-disulfide isomerase/thioredoxin